MFDFDFDIDYGDDDQRRHETSSSCSLSLVKEIMSYLELHCRDRMHATDDICTVHTCAHIYLYLSCPSVRRPRGVK